MARELPTTPPESNIRLLELTLISAIGAVALLGLAAAFLIHKDPVILARFCADLNSANTVLAVQFGQPSHFPWV